MKYYFINIAKHILFWLAFFAFIRTLYLLFNYDEILRENIGIGPILLSYFYAIKLDLSATGYILLIQYIWIIISGNRRINSLATSIVNITAFLFLLIYAFLIVGEMGIYKPWGTRLYYRA
ncbi:MAG: hypothetical protein C0594_16890, partial [Marinilabiliales bacterium]